MQSTNVVIAHNVHADCFAHVDSQKHTAADLAVRDGAKPLKHRGWCTSQEEEERTGLPICASMGGDVGQIPHWGQLCSLTRLFQQLKPSLQLPTRVVDNIQYAFSADKDGSDES